LIDASDKVFAGPDAFQPGWFGALGGSLVRKPRQTAFAG
jgi:hypothetical protein